MPGACSTDLRERVLVAVESGEPADAVAEEFILNPAVGASNGQRAGKNFNLWL